MKLTNWLYGALALSMLTACSENDLSEKGIQDPANEWTDSGVSGYLAVEIKLPQTDGSTRAEGDEYKDNGNVNFNDGTADEYAVNNAIILLFKGKKSDGEKKAKFYRAQKLTKPFFTNQPEHDNITSSYLAAIPVSNDYDPQDGDNFWAWVILNNNESSTAVSTDSNGKITVKIAGNPITNEDTFEKLLETTTTNSFLDTDDGRRFFMTNAPLSTQAGGYTNTKGADLGKEGTIHYLTDLGSTVYNTPDEAKTKGKKCVYVERAVAKVTYQGNDVANDAFQLKFYDGDGKEIKGDGAPNVVIEATVKYALTNTNVTSYVIRNVEFGANSHFSWDLATPNKLTDGVMHYRMVGYTPMPQLGSPFHSEEVNLYRTYWCKDPNYDKQMERSVTVTEGATEGATKIESDKNVIMEVANNFSSLSTPLYCKENTFEVQYQNYGNSTMAIFQVDYNIHTEDSEGKVIDVCKNLFIKDGDKSKVYLSDKSAASDEINRICNDTEIRNAMRLSLKADAPNEEYTVNDCLDIIFTKEVKEGKTTPVLWISDIKLIKDKDGKFFDDESVEKFRALIGSPDGTQEYKKYDAEGKVVTDAEGNEMKDKPQTLHNLLADVNALNDIIEYEDCVSYYAVPIKHFGDDLTPWDKANITGTTTKAVYNGGKEWSDDTNNDHAKKYLGRYGVVRNNWYELVINGITGLGYPTIHDIYDDNGLSNDNNETKKYFAVEVHILSWAKRTQGVTF